MLHSKQAYIKAIKKLFPLGSYWKAQFDDAQSDLSLWVEAKAEELYRFKSRFPDLITESTPKTADASLEDWERVLFGTASPQLPKDIRRRLLLTKRKGCVNRAVLNEIAAQFSAKITRVYYPFRPFFCGHTRIGKGQTASPQVFSILFITAQLQDNRLKKDFETMIRQVLLANVSVYFFYI